MWVYGTMGFLGGSDGKESAWNAGDPGLITVGKIPWRRTWQPTPVFLPEEFPWSEEPGGLQSMGSQRVRHDRATEHSIVYGLYYLHDFYANSKFFT